MSSRGARLSRNQARSATDCSRPRRRDGLIDQRAAAQVQARVSIASYSRNVTYGPRCVLDARTNSEWIPLGRTARRMGAATNQAAEEGYRLVRNGRISARNSAPGGRNEPPRCEKGQSELLVPTGLLMSGRLDSNQRPPEPHSGGTGRESRKDRPFLNLRIPYFPHFTLRNPHFPQNLLSFLPFPTCGIRPCGAPEHGRVAPCAVSGELPRVSAGGSILRSM